MNTRKILIVNMNYLGDALMTTPAIRVVKRKFPEASIDVIAGSTASYGALEILTLDNDINRLIARTDGGSLARGWQLFNVIRTGNYDVVVVLPTIPFYNAIAGLFPRVHVVTVPKAREDIHMAEHMLSTIASALSDNSPERQMVMSVSPTANSRAVYLLSDLAAGKPTVILNLGASRPQKRWPSVHFAKTAELLIRSGRNVVLVGGGNNFDLDSAKRVTDWLEITGMDGCSSFINVVGKTSLEELSGIIETGDILVTADTGAMHIAAALNIPAVSLFGSTNAAFTGPYGGSNNVIIDLKLPCAPCGTHPTCGGKYQCMTRISPEMVVDAIESVLIDVGNAACRK